MKAWEIQRAWGIENLRETEKPEPKPSAGEVVIAVKAASLNYRDRIKGQLPCFTPAVPGTGRGRGFRTAQSASGCG